MPVLLSHFVEIAQGLSAVLRKQSRSVEVQHNELISTISTLETHLGTMFRT